MTDHYAYKGIKLDQIITRDDLQLRVDGTDQELVERYADDWRNGVEFDPVQVVEIESDQYLLAHGYHRFESAKLAERDFIYAYIYKGGEAKALELARLGNISNGKQLTTQDKKLVVLAAVLDPAFSDSSTRDIRAAVKNIVSQPVIGAIKKCVELVQQDLTDQQILSATSYNTINADLIDLVRARLDHPEPETIDLAVGCTVTMPNGTTDTVVEIYGRLVYTENRRQPINQEKIRVIAPAPANTSTSEQEPAARPAGTEQPADSDNGYQDRFKSGDRVVLKENRDDIPGGSKGTVIEKFNSFYVNFDDQWRWNNGDILRFCEVIEDETAKRVFHTAAVSEQDDPFQPGDRIIIRETYNRESYDDIPAGSKGTVIERVGRLYIKFDHLEYTTNGDLLKLCDFDLLVNDDSEQQPAPDTSQQEQPDPAPAARPADDTGSLDQPDAKLQLLQTGEKSRIKKPVVRYFGGKWRTGDWLISQFPMHKTYVEPFCGGANVFFQLPIRDKVTSVLNDMNGDVTNFFDVLRTDTNELVRQIQLTPFSRQEHDIAYQDDTDDPMERARLFFVRAWQSFGSGEARHQVGTRYKTGWRFQINQDSRNALTNEWNQTDRLYIAAYMLKQAMIENTPALECIERYDSPTTFFYVDPPYVHDTRYKNSGYSHEMTDDEHRDLAAALHNIEGMAIISGYPSDLYDELYSGWRRVEKQTRANVNNKVTECIWISPDADQNQLPMIASGD